MTNHILQIPELKTTSNGRQHQNIKKGISQQPNHILQIPELKTTSNGRQHQNIKKGISKQPRIGSYSNSLHELR